ncbi:MAG: acyl-CoA desaturase [Candidatus Nanopelagicales bacterium]
MTAVVEPDASPARPATEPMASGMRTTIGVFVGVPLLAVALAVPVAWGGWLGWTDLILAGVFYVIAAAGITVGFHRHFTHGSFKAPTWVSVMLAVAGSTAIEGSLDQWVADHRRHHARSDEEGDPHSPWRYGTTRRAVAKGLVFAHVGWLFDGQQSSIDRYAPDIRSQSALRRVSRLFPWIVASSIIAPAILGGLITWSWEGALTALFWAGLVRIALVHHITWSINSICHVFGQRPFRTRDNSTNNRWLALPSLGESWHNLHHAEPTAARHGVLQGQVDISAGIIRTMERLRLARDVRWPSPARLAAKVQDPAIRRRIRGWTPDLDTAGSALPSSPAA